MPNPNPSSKDPTAEAYQDAEDWEDVRSNEEILEIASQTNVLFHALMLCSPELKGSHPTGPPRPLYFTLDFVRRTYVEYILPLLPTDAPYTAREVANPFLFDYTAEKPKPTEPNPAFLEDEAGWPEVDDELYMDAIGRNVMVSLAILEAHEAGSRGAMVLTGCYDFHPRIKEVATMIVHGGRD